MKIKKCRNCNGNCLIELFSLGKLYLTGKFLINTKKLRSDYLNLIICEDCKLVQLDRNFNMKYLYNNDYGYRSGINQTMRDHLRLTALKLQKLTKIKKRELVLDIASNDGTLLNFYSNNLVKVGVDPLIDKFKKHGFYDKVNYKYSDFFDYKIIKKKNIFKKKFKIITAISVFYDLKNPNDFLRAIKSILDTDGVFILEFADLYSIFKYKMFDTICHEHLEYYSIKVIKKMLENNGLRFFDHNFNKINGGSSVFFICHNTSKFKSKNKKISNLLRNEKKLGIYEPKKFKIFYKKIIKDKKKLIDLLKKIKSNKKTIHGYGASTKGNVLLQFFKIGKKYIDFISDRNPQKYSCLTPGTDIKIISEEESRNLKPDYYLVLPWHFKNEILKRENKIRELGTKFIFPLPSLNIH
jgi:hypothetical protein